MSIKKQIPNCITLINLFCGSIAVLFAVQGDLKFAAVFVGLGVFFDFFDGLAARLLNAQSELGLQLDSLADMVTSGLVPGIVMYQLLTQVYGKPFYVLPGNWGADQLFSTIDMSYISLVGLFIALASAYRLAKFNIDTRQATSFIGLPTPANALLILSLPLILHFHNDVWIRTLIFSKWFLIALTFLSCYLLNAKIPLFALKFNNWKFKDNRVKYIFLVLIIVLVALFKFIAIPVIILIYVLLSLLFKKELL